MKHENKYSSSVQVIKSYNNKIVLTAEAIRLMEINAKTHIYIHTYVHRPLTYRIDRIARADNATK